MDTIARKPTNIVLVSGILIAIFFYPLVGYFLNTGQAINFTTLFCSRLLIWLEVVLLYLYAIRIEKTSYLLWPETKYPFKFYLLSFLALYGLTIVAGIISKSPVWFGYPDDKRIMYRMVGILNLNVPLLLFSALTAGVTEEFIFRGYLVPRLELLFKNTYMPVIISALMFGGIHYKYHSLGEVIFATLFGVVFAIHYQKYRNIKILMFTHGVVDLVSFLLFRVAQVHHIPLK